MDENAQNLQQKEVQAIIGLMLELNNSRGPGSWHTKRSLRYNYLFVSCATNKGVGLRERGKFGLSQHIYLYINGKAKIRILKIWQKKFNKIKSLIK